MSNSRMSANESERCLTDGRKRFPFQIHSRKSWSTSRLVVGIAVAICLSLGPAAPASGQETPEAMRQKVDNLRKDLASDDFEKRAKAAKELGNLGEAAKDAIPDLFRAMMDLADFSPRFDGPGDSVIESASAISRIGSIEVIKDCVTHLRTIDLNDPRRERLASVMRQLYKPGNREINNLLCELLKDKSIITRFVAAELMVNRGTRIPEAISPLAELLKSEESLEAHAAASALGQYGPVAKETIPIFMAIFKDKKAERSRRTSALRALGRIGVEDSEVAVLLRKTLRDETAHNDFRFQAVEGLAISKYGESALPDIISFHVAIHRQLERDGSIDNEQVAGGVRVSLLIRRSIDSRLLEAVCKLNPDKRSLPGLIQVFEKLDWSDTTSRERGLKALARIGPDAKPAVPTVFAAIDSTDGRGITVHAESLHRILGADSVRFVREHAQHVNNPDLARAYDALARTLAEIKK